LSANTNSNDISNQGTGFAVQFVLGQFIAQSVLSSAEFSSFLLLYTWLNVCAAGWIVTVASAWQCL